MALCDEIIPLLGPFEDAELPPTEMQNVARHLAACPRCEDALKDYRLIGSGLRAAALEPEMGDFSDAVMAKIARIRVPLRVRVGYYFNRFGERIGAAAAMGMAAAAAAAITVVLVTPVARNVAGRQDAENPAAARNPTMLASIARPNAARLADVSPASITSANTPLAPDNSEAIISRLEADSPSVAVWSEPRTDTTVIWVPDQQP
jgi:anti-sigma factor RsiW